MPHTPSTPDPQARFAHLCINRISRAPQDKFGWVDLTPLYLILKDE